MREEAGVWEAEREDSESEPAPTRMGRKAAQRLASGSSSAASSQRRASLSSLLGRRIPSRARAAHELQSYLRMAYSTEPVEVPDRPQRMQLSSRLGLVIGGLLVLVGLFFAVVSLLGAPEVQSREAQASEANSTSPHADSELGRQALEKVAVRDPSRAGSRPSAGGSAAQLGRSNAGGVTGGANGGAAGEAGRHPVELTVHVTGAVTNPGLYRLATGSRVWDAIEAAGGGSADADLEQLNLARPIGDGEQIRIPHQGEDASQWGASGGAGNGAGAGAGGGVGGSPGSGGAGGGGSGLVNINQADASGLEALPGIGPALAARIVQYREAHGPFASVDDLRSVPGIGNAKLEGLRDAATV